MSEWKTVQINDVSDVIMGQSPSSTSCNEESIGYPFLQGCAEFGKRFPLIKFHCSEPKKIAPENSILISVRAPVGTTNRTKVKVCIGRGLAAIYGNSIDQDLLHYKIIQHTPDLERVSQGSTFLAINTSDLNTLKINIPTSLSEQRKIARILSTVDAVIEETEAAIAKYKAIKSGMMHDLFTRGIDPATGKLRPPQCEAPELYKLTELGWVPKEWEVEPLSNKTTTYAGGTPSRNREEFYGGTIPWVSSSEVNSPKIYNTKEFITQEGLENSSAKHVKAGSVLIAMYGATAGKIARLLIDATTNQAVLACIDSNGLSTRYLFYVLAFLRESILYKVQGSGQPNLSKCIIDSTVLSIPTPREQHAIVRGLESIDVIIEQEDSNLKKHQQLKSALMSDLLTGKVRVKYKENETLEAL